MELRLKITPRKLTNLNVGPTYAFGGNKASIETAVRRSIGTYGVTFTNGGWAYRNGENVYGIIYEKHRKKVVTEVQTHSKNGRRLAKPKITKTITPAHWVAFIYTFPEEVLHILGKTVKQGERTFELVSKR